MCKNILSVAVAVLFVMMENICRGFPVPNGGTVYVLVPVSSELFNRFPYIYAHPTQSIDSGKIPTAEEEEETKSVTTGLKLNPGLFPTLPGPMLQTKNTQKGVIGDIIMAIPFLPFEINVPDFLQWLFQGITSFAQNVPFINQFGGPNPVNAMRIDGFPPSALPLVVAYPQGTSSLPWNFRQPNQQRIFQVPGPYYTPTSGANFNSF